MLWRLADPSPTEEPAWFASPEDSIPARSTNQATKASRNVSPNSIILNLISKVSDEHSPAPGVISPIALAPAYTTTASVDHPVLLPATRYAMEAVTCPSAPTATTPITTSSTTPVAVPAAGTIDPGIALGSARLIARRILRTAEWRTTAGTARPAARKGVGHGARSGRQRCPSPLTARPAQPRPAARPGRWRNPPPGNRHEKRGSEVPPRLLHPLACMLYPVFCLLYPVFFRPTASSLLSLRSGSPACPSGRSRCRR
jgi:hypothetical protein